jgi:hypothetical protein
VDLVFLFTHGCRSPADIDSRALTLTGMPVPLEGESLLRQVSPIAATGSRRKAHFISLYKTSVEGNPCRGIYS